MSRIDQSKAAVKAARSYAEDYALVYSVRDIITVGEFLELLDGSKSDAEFLTKLALWEVEYKDRRK